LDNRIEILKINQDIDKNVMNQSKRYEQICNEIDDIYFDDKDMPSWSELISGRRDKESSQEKSLYKRYEHEGFYFLISRS